MSIRWSWRQRFNQIQLPFKLIFSESISKNPSLPHPRIKEGGRGGGEGEGRRKHTKKRCQADDNHN